MGIMQRMILMLSVAALITTSVFADGYTSSSAFSAAIASMSNVTTANFDSDPTGNIAQGATVDGIQFNYNIDGGLDSLAIVSSLIYFDTTSPPNYLGSNDLGTAALFPGDSVTMSFASPVNALGFFIIGGPYNNGDFTLSSTTATAISSNVLEETLGDGGQVIFLGITSTTAFSSATVSLDPSAGELWNLDDITTAQIPASPTPEPDSVVLAVEGLLAFCALLLWKMRAARAELSR
jgi:hypothetical protein